MELIASKIKKTKKILGMIFNSLELGMLIKKYYRHHLKNKCLILFNNYFSEFHDT